MNTLLSNLVSFFSSLFEPNGTARKSVTASIDGKRSDATGIASEDSSSVDAAGTAKPSLKMLEEQCRHALLCNPTGDLSKNLRMCVSLVFSDPEAFLAPLREWADRGRKFRMESEAMVARGEDRTGFAFDSLKRDVLAYLDGVLTDDRRRDAAWFMLEPFFEEPETPAEPKPEKAPDKPAKSVTVAPKKSVPDVPSKSILLREILKYASWEDPIGKQRLNEALSALEKDYPEAVLEGKQQVEKGKKLSAFKNQAYKAGCSGKPLESVLEKMKEENIIEQNHLSFVEKSYNKGKDARMRRFQANQIKKELIKAKNKNGAASIPPPKPAKTPAPETTTVNTPKNSGMDMIEKIGNGHANILSALKPSPSWTILIDETGRNFSSSGIVQDCGRMVALFVPNGESLPDLPQEWHAVDQSLNGEHGILNVIGRIQSAKCGVLGIPVTVLPKTTVADQWISCVEDILSLGFRLLPLDGDTKISIFVEQRGYFSGSNGSIMLTKTVDDVLHRLAYAFPERAKKLSVGKSHIIRKGDHPWNGYADAVAFMWGSPLMRKKDLLDTTGWIGPCLFERDSAKILIRCLDIFSKEQKLDATDWTKLFELSASESDTSLASAFLHALGQETRNNTFLWRTFLDETVRHLDSKAIRMDLLNAQVRWLKQWEPVDTQLPPRIRLMWLTSKLASANHAGCTNLHESDAFRKEFDELCERLRREDCPLVAHAKLHLAVSYTNAFEFEKARDLLLPMRDWPVEGLGLRMEGRLLSSLGQHTAFLGDSAGALPLFDEAISLFRDLSEFSRLEIGQTSAYAATAAMDAKTPDANERLAAYIWGAPFSEERFVAEARRLAASSRPDEKYVHHILLRHLVELPEDHPARAAYLAEKDRWSEPAFGHPWELIEFYRSLLLPKGSMRNERLLSAFNLAMSEDGATLQVIAAVIAGAAIADEPADDREQYANLIACCAETLPALGETRIAALRSQLDPATRIDPLSLARTVLPFNFR